MISQISQTVELVRRYGGPLSHAALEPSSRQFRIPDMEGLVGFLLFRRCAVVLGDPICRSEDKVRFAEGFAEHCAKQGWSILYVGATDCMMPYAQARNYASMEFADLLMTEPAHDPEAGPKARHLRQHLNHARRMGVTVREYLEGPDEEFEARANAACDAWLAGRQGPQMFLLRPRLFADRLGRRWFAAELGGKVVGVLSMLRVGCNQCGYLINLVFSSPGAPPHTSELLVAAALRSMCDEGAGLVCLGIGPRETLGRVEGCGAVTEFFSRALYRLAAGLMHQHGKTLFWEKFRVTEREPLYLLFQSSHIGPSTICALFQTIHFPAAG